MGRWRVAVGFVVFCMSGNARAADYYVNGGAGAGGDGSAGAPFVTIQAGMDVAVAGDSVIVAPGTYLEALQTQANGSDGMPVIVRATEPRMVIVETSGRVLDVAHAYNEFEGIVFDGGYGDSDAIRGNGGDFLVLRNVEVRRSGADCIDLGTNTGFTLVDSFVHHCVAGEGGMQSDAHGVTGDSVFDVTITDTEIGMLSGDAIQFSPPRQPWDNVVVERVVMWSGALDEDTPGLSAGTIIGENAIDTKVASGQSPSLVLRDTVAYGWRGAITNQGAFNIKEEVDCLIDGTTVWDSEIAFRLRGPSRVRVYNAVVSRTDVAFRLEDALADAQLLNVTLGSDIGALFTGGGDDPTGLDVRNMLVLGELPGEASDSSNLATAADVFVDPANHDYHLLEDSAPVDAGLDIAEVATDRDGVMRPVGSAHDVGAYEWTDMPPPGTTGTTSGGSSDSGDTGTDGGTSDSDSNGSSGGTDSGSGSDSAGTGSDSAGTDSGDDSGCGCRSRSGPPSVAWGIPLFFAMLRCRSRRR